jgi:hypothetical protein
VSHGAEHRPGGTRAPWETEERAWEAKISGDKHKEDKDESAGSVKSHKNGDKKKKKMKKVVFYETDSSTPSTSNAESTSSKR